MKKTIIISSLVVAAGLTAGILLNQPQETKEALKVANSVEVVEPLDNKVVDVAETASEAPQPTLVQETSTVSSQENINATDDSTKIEFPQFYQEVANASMRQGKFTRLNSMQIWIQPIVNALYPHYVSGELLMDENFDTAVGACADKAIAIWIESGVDAARNVTCD